MKSDEIRREDLKSYHSCRGVGRGSETSRPWKSTAPQAMSTSCDKLKSFSTSFRSNLDAASFKILKRKKTIDLEKPVKSLENI